MNKQKEIENSFGGITSHFEGIRVIGKMVAKEVNTYINYKRGWMANKVIEVLVDRDDILYEQTLLLRCSTHNYRCRRRLVTN